MAWSKTTLAPGTARSSPWPPSAQVGLTQQRDAVQGTPNLGRYVRAIPHPGGFRMPANGIRGGRQGPNVSGKRDLPYDVWAKMSPHGQHVCRDIVAEPGEVVVVNWSPDYGKAGAHGHVTCLGLRSGVSRRRVQGTYRARMASMWRGFERWCVDVPAMHDVATNHSPHLTRAHGMMLMRVDRLDGRRASECVAVSCPVAARLARLAH